MLNYPVHYQVEPPALFTRLELFARFLAFLLIGILGVSFGSVFVLAYLALPVVAATRISSRGADVYLRDDAPRLARALRWYDAVCAWAGLVTDRLPAQTHDETILLSIEPGGHPTARSALLRVFHGLPSAIVLAVLLWVGALVWIWAALSILFHRRVGSAAFAYLVGLQRWSIRLLAFQASLVEPYPPFSFDDAAITHVSATAVVAS